MKERLLDKGYAALNEKKFEEALELFVSMGINGVETPQTELAIVICLVELGRIEEAIEHCERILKEIFTEDILDVYISLLLQTDQFEQAEKVIDDVIANEAISELYRMKLQNLLQIAEKGTGGKNVSFQTREQINEVENILLHGHDVTKQMELISMLETVDVQSILNVLKRYLQDEKKNPVLKSLIIQVLNNKEIDEDILVCKFGKSSVINPKLLEDRAFHFGEEVSKIFSKYIENDNPAVFQVLNEHWNYYVFSHYPFVLEPEDAKLWAVSLYIFGVRMYDIAEEQEEIEKFYLHHKDPVENIIKRFVDSVDMIHEP